jgi:hypothetical protein
VDQVRAIHYGKAGFIGEFEKVVTGVTPEREPMLPGEGPGPLGSAGMISRSRRTRGAGIRDDGGMPDDELLERVRELRARGRSPKEIARALKVRPAIVTPLIRRLAAAEPQEKEVPLVGCWVNQGWSSMVLTRQIVFGAVGYARGLGFKPHADFAKAAGHLGGWDGVCDLEFGRDGMPMYIEGPHDDTWRIMHTLRRNVGDGNFHYLVGLRS